MKTSACLDIDALAALLEAAANEEVAEYSAHLETCAHCQQTLTQLADSSRSWDEVTRHLPQRQGGACAAAPALDRVMAQLKNELTLVARTAGDGDEEQDAALSILSAADRPDLLGYLGGYEVQEVIGRGGMGVVFKALDPVLQRYVAIKVMAAAALAASADARRRFVREAQAAAAVCHDHIVTVHGVHEVDGRPYLVLQYVAGESLQARLDRAGPLPTREVVQIGLQTALGLAAAHAQGLIHRDIKPANLLLEEGTARVKITDFGLARMADDVQLTQLGALAGTPEYMAPEQARGETVDHRADLFSLGSVLYALCTGAPPFRGATALAVLRQVSEHTPAPIHSLNSEVPAWLETLIGRLMAKEPGDRFQSAAEVAALLEGYLAHLHQPAMCAAPALPGAPRAPSGRQTMRPQRTTRTWLLLAAALGGGVGLLGVIGAALLNFGPGTSGADAPPSPEPKSLQPTTGLVCLLVNKQSGRCLSVGGSAERGSKVVQGPTPEEAGASERWTLLGAGKTFRLRNESSRLVLEIGHGNRNPGVQAIHWEDQVTAAHQQWTFEPVEGGYLLRAGHSQFVLSIGQGSLDEGGRAVQWEYVPGALEQCWELREGALAGEAAEENPAATEVQQFHADLRGGVLPPQLKVVGDPGGKFVKMEPGGVRISLPKDRDNPAAVGLRAYMPLRGDFEITTLVELLKVEEQESSFGVGAILRIEKANSPEAATIARLLRAKSGHVVYWDRSTLKPDGQLGFDGRAQPCEAMQVRLRLKRTGTILSYQWASAAAAEDFKEIHQTEFGAEDIKQVGVSATKGALEVRVLDLHIKAAAFPKQEYYHSFKDNPANAAGWELMGPAAAECVRFEREGLRLTLPAGFPDSRPSTGVVNHFGVRGDFEITMAYEILQEPEHADAGGQTRFALALSLDKPNPKHYQATLLRRVVKEGAQYFSWISLGAPEAAKRQMRETPTRAKSGRLRLARTGAKLSYLVSEGEDASFKLLDRFVLGAEDVKEVRIVASTGGEKAALDVRVFDLRIKADSFPKPAPPRVAAVPPPPKADYAQEYYHSFKGNPVKPAGWGGYGPNADECIRFEPEGLRLTLPTGWGGERPSTGAKTEFSVQGDFEITMSFEILKEPGPMETGKIGTRLNLGVFKDTAFRNSPHNEVATMTRSMGAKSGPAFVTWMRLRDAAADTDVIKSHSYPTKAKSGRLRLVRSGGDLFYLKSEGADEHFTPLKKAWFGTEDLYTVQVGGATGGETGMLDARVTDIRIRAQALPNAPATAPAAAAADVSEKSGGRGWLVVALLISGVVLVLFGVTAVAAYLLRRRATTAAPGSDRPPRSAAAIAPVSVLCPACGKKLRAKGASAGKKIKCPQCGKAVPVPATEPPGRPEPSNVMEGKPPSR